MPKIVSFREQLGEFSLPFSGWGLAALALTGVGVALWVGAGRKLRPNSFRSRGLRGGPNPYEDHGSFRYYVFLTRGPEVGAWYGIDSGWATKSEADRAAERVRRTRPLEMGVHVFTRRHLKTIGHNPMYVRSWKRAPRRTDMVANPRFRVRLVDPVGKEVGRYSVLDRDTPHAWYTAGRVARAMGLTWVTSKPTRGRTLRMTVKPRHRAA